MDFTDHVFTTMFEALNSALASIVGKYAAVIGIVAPALRIGIVIYISLLGYAIMRGAVQYPFREYVYRGVQLAFLYFAVTSLYGSQSACSPWADCPDSSRPHSAEPTSAAWADSTTSWRVQALLLPKRCAQSPIITQRPIRAYFRTWVTLSCQR